MKPRTAIIVALVGIVLLPSSGYAYLGPGGVITAIGAMLALLAAIVAAIFGFLWFPLKRLLIWVRNHRRSPDVPLPPGTTETTGG